VEVEAPGDARTFAFKLCKSCSSRTVISATGRCFGLGDGRKPGSMGCLFRLGDIGDDGGGLYMLLAELETDCEV